jgi:excisionase family DNA binding protein
MAKESDATQLTRAWWSVREARGYVQCGASRLYGAVRSGELRAGRIGRRLRFRREWLDAWVQKGVKDV